MNSILVKGNLARSINCLFSSTLVNSKETTGPPRGFIVPTEPSTKGPSIFTHSNSLSQWGQSCGRAQIDQICFEVALVLTTSVCSHLNMVNSLPLSIKFFEKTRAC